jgi:hypothetical protein
MTIKQWYDRLGKSLLTAEGRGDCFLTDIDGQHFRIFLADGELSYLPIKPGELTGDYEARLHDEVSKSILEGDADVMIAVNWFLDRVAYCEADRQEILANWKARAPQ